MFTARNIQGILHMLCAVLLRFTERYIKKNYGKPLETCLSRLHATMLEIILPDDGQGKRANVTTNRTQYLKARKQKVLFASKFQVCCGKKCI